jgi:hypothetical protein
MTNEELQKWVDKKIAEYKEDKVDCLEMMLYNTNQIIEQFLNSPTSQATKGVLENCMKCNKKFISVVDSGVVG